MVGAAVQRHPVPLSLLLLAVPWPGKMEPSAGHYVIFHNMLVVMTPSPVSLVSFPGRIKKSLRHVVSKKILKLNAMQLCYNEFLS